MNFKELLEYPYLEFSFVELVFCKLALDKSEFTNIIWVKYKKILNKDFYFHLQIIIALIYPKAFFYFFNIYLLIYILNWLFFVFLYIWFNFIYGNRIKNMYLRWQPNIMNTLLFLKVKIFILKNKINIIIILLKMIYIKIKKNIIMVLIFLWNIYVILKKNIIMILTYVKNKYIYVKQKINSFLKSAENFLDWIDGLPGYYYSKFSKIFKKKFFEISSEIGRRWRVFIGYYIDIITYWYNKIIWFITKRIYELLDFYSRELVYFINNFLTWRRLKNWYLKKKKKMIKRRLLIVAYYLCKKIKIRLWIFSLKDIFEDNLNNIPRFLKRVKYLYIVYLPYWYYYKVLVVWHIAEAIKTIYLFSRLIYIYIRYKIICWRSKKK